MGVPNSLVACVILRTCGCQSGASAADSPRHPSYRPPMCSDEGRGRGTGYCKRLPLAASDAAGRWASYVKLTVKLTPRLKLWKARSRLYRRRFLQPNTHFSAFFEIYKIDIPLHRSRFKNCIFLIAKFCKFCGKFRDLLQNSAEIF